MLSINGLFFDFSVLDMKDTPAFLNALTTSMHVHRDLDTLSFGFGMTTARSSSTG